MSLMAASCSNQAESTCVVFEDPEMQAAFEAWSSLYRNSIKASYGEDATWATYFQNPEGLKGKLYGSDSAFYAVMELMKSSGVARDMWCFGDTSIAVLEDSNATEISPDSVIQMHILRRPYCFNIWGEAGRWAEGRLKHSTYDGRPVLDYLARSGAVSHDTWFELHEANGNDCLLELMLLFVEGSYFFDEAATTVISRSSYPKNQ